jgi:carboxyl-terminal processing protease
LRKNILAIIAPLKGSPADRAGLRSQDLIVAINGASTENEEVDQAVSKIRGEIGSTVKLTIMREGWEKPKDFTITREKISLPTLSYELKEKNIGYVQIYSFNGNVNELFYNAMVQAQKDGVEGIVLDLRNNPGGYLDVAVDIAGWFLKKKSLVVSEESRQGIGNQYRTQGNEALVNVPVVVLINKGSASASEILAGALRDQRKAPLIGEKSFGKGTIQQIKNLSDGSSIKITIAHWVMPSGKIIDHEGIEPDILVPVTEADNEKKDDIQLQKALEVLKLEMKK